mmetsp:Transcript_3006/g.4427  ORF Transcript_3006/g.4427 Transcript_3006/m.4427 type:complete len:619 (-) Transcript_3006:79-1935(-)
MVATRRSQRSASAAVEAKRVKVEHSAPIPAAVTSASTPDETSSFTRAASPTTTNFVFKGVSYETYEEMVKAKRMRNNEMLIKSGLLEASAKLKEEVYSSNGVNRKTEATRRGLRADRKRKDTMPDPPRRKSSRISGGKADGLFIEDEQRGGRLILGGVGTGGDGVGAGGDASAELYLGAKVQIERHVNSFYNQRINDGSDLSIKEVVELAGQKWVKEDSVSQAEKFVENLSSNVNDDSIETKSSCSKGTDRSSPKSSATSMTSLAAQVDNLTADDEECVAKVVPERIYAVTFHPSDHKVLAVCGDKQGHVGFWDVDSDSSSTDSNGVHLFKPHGRPVSNLEWNKSGSRLYSSSYDGTVKMFDINRQSVVETFATYDDSEEFKGELGYGVDEGRKFWTQYMCLDPRNDDNSMFISTSMGGLIHLDLRGKSKITFDLTLSKKKINSISVHPNENAVATAGLDGEVNIWDLRKLETSRKVSPLATQRSSKSINSAFFSPSGKHLLTTTMADTLDIISDAHLQSGLIKTPTHRIRHDNHTGRWLTTFMAQWHPTVTNEELFVVGSMSRPRRMEFFDANAGQMLRGISGDSLTAVVSRCCFHPSTNRLIGMGGNSSGRVTIFR